MPTILIIDDSHLSRTVARLTLSRAGYDVIEAADGKAGLEAALRHQPDCIVAGLDIPALDGLTVVKSLRCEGLETPIVLITSCARKQTINRVRLAGVQRVIERASLERDVVAVVHESIRDSTRAAERNGPGIFGGPG